MKNNFLTQQLLAFIRQKGELLEFQKLFFLYSFFCFVFEEIGRRGECSASVNEIYIFCAGSSNCAQSEIHTPSDCASRVKNEIKNCDQINHLFSTSKCKQDDTTSMSVTFCMCQYPNSNLDTYTASDFNVYTLGKKHPRWVLG